MTGSMETPKLAEDESDEEDPGDADPERQDPDAAEDHAQDGDQAENEQGVADGVLE